MAPAALRRLRVALRTRAAGWARRRQGPDRLPLRLHGRRIYILPTRSGAGFAVMLAGMLFGGLNYGNSVALLLCFVLGALAAVAMFQCHRRLLGLQVRAAEVLPTFAGDAPVLRVRVHGAGLDAADLAIRIAPPGGPDGEWASFEPQESGEAVALPRAQPAARGPWPLPRLRLEQRAPFGLFKAWAWLHVPATGLVWPRPAGTRPLPPSPGQLRGEQLLHAGLDEWTGLRPFREGDSPRQVAWKAYARGAPLLVREYHDPGGSERRLDPALLPDLSTEARISQLAAWVEAASAAGERWSLHLPEARLEPGTGAAHRRASLDELAWLGFARERGA